VPLARIARIIVLGITWPVRRLLRDEGVLPPEEADEFIRGVLLEPGSPEAVEHMRSVLLREGLSKGGAEAFLLRKSAEGWH
jgi:hypothetical protein